jgi:hypothetical protein
MLSAGCRSSATVIQRPKSLMRRQKSTKPDFFTAKDWLVIGMSAVALIVSILSFYFANIRVDDRLIARAADFMVERGGNDTTQYADGFLTVRAAFANTGNRPSVVHRINYRVWTDSTTDKGSVNGTALTDPSALPLTLGPRDVQVISMRIPFGVLLANQSRGMAVVQDSSARVLWCRFDYEALDSNGELHFGNIGMVARIEVTRDGFRSLRTSSIAARDVFQ